MEDRTKGSSLFEQALLRRRDYRRVTQMLRWIDPNTKTACIHASKATMQAVCSCCRKTAEFSGRSRTTRNRDGRLAGKSASTAVETQVRPEADTDSLAVAARTSRCARRARTCAKPSREIGEATSGPTGSRLGSVDDVRLSKRRLARSKPGGGETGGTVAPRGA